MAKLYLAASRARSGAAFAIVLLAAGAVGGAPASASGDASANPSATGGSAPTPSELRVYTNDDLERYDVGSSRPNRSGDGRGLGDGRLAWREIYAFIEGERERELDERRLRIERERIAAESIPYERRDRVWLPTRFGPFIGSCTGIGKRCRTDGRDRGEDRPEDRLPGIPRLDHGRYSELSGADAVPERGRRSP